MAPPETIIARRIGSAPAHLVIIAVDGARFQIPWEQCSTRLANATPAERSRMALSSSGTDIHWPLIDEDLAISALVTNALNPR
jgi:hypothetical protein